MSRAVIIHGCPDREEYLNHGASESNTTWIPWLQRELLRAGHIVQTPEMFQPYAPVWDIWREEFERNLDDKPMILVGWSCGGGFLVRWLSEHPDVEFERLVLVAPWLDPDRDDTTDFFEFEIDEKLARRSGDVHFFYSENDNVRGIQESFKILKDAIPGMIEHKYNFRHFTAEDLGSAEFPDLLAVCK